MTRFLSERPSLTRRLAAIAVVAHAVISLAHGSAHSVGRVPLSSIASIYVIVVIFAAPLVGLLLLFTPRQRAGAIVIGVSMAASLVFGVWNHYVVAGPDHVSHVAERVRPAFQATAALLVASELAGTWIGAALARGGRTHKSARPRRSQAVV